MWVLVPGLCNIALVDATRARHNGLTCRPLRDARRDALPYERVRSAPQLSGLSGLSDAKEREIRCASPG